MTHTGRTSENPTPDTRRPTNALSTTMRDLLVVAVVGVIVMFTNLGGPRLWDRDEPRNAGCALEMRLRGATAIAGSTKHDHEQPVRS